MTRTPPTNYAPFSQLGDMPVEQFLADYWQQKPLLVKQAFPGYETPVTAEELAGFALEDDVESRLIEERVNADSLRSNWQVSHGPLAEQAFAQLPASHWTLLVQAVDQLVPELGHLLNRFRFVPNWRLDDLMASFATDGGGVGPHFDYYDVFLLQAQGRRRWRLGQMCDSTSACRDDAPMRILTEFDTQADYLLEPGDMLYVPPGLAHWGTAEGECMTFSIGFRAPSHADVLLDYSAQVAADLSADRRYSDGGTVPPAHPGEITAAAVSRIEAILRELTTDPSRIAHWLAEYGTHSKRNAPEPLHTTQPDANPASKRIALKPRVRAAYVVTDNQRAVLYVDGVAYTCSRELARALSSYQPFTRTPPYQIQPHERLDGQTQTQDQPSNNDLVVLESLTENDWLIGYA